MSSSPEFTELQVHTGKCLPAIPRLHYDPKLPKWVVPKPGFPDSVPAHACQRSGVGLYAHRHLPGETLPQPLLVLQGPGLTPSLGIQFPLHVPQRTPASGFSHQWGRRGTLFLAPWLSVGPAHSREGQLAGDQPPGETTRIVACKLLSASL